MPPALYTSINASLGKKVRGRVSLSEYPPDWSGPLCLAGWDSLSTRRWSDTRAPGCIEPQAPAADWYGLDQRGLDADTLARNASISMRQLVSENLGVVMISASSPSE